MPDRKRTRPSHVDPLLYEPIGRVAVEFGIVEDRLQWAIEALFLGSPDPQAVRILVGPLGFAEKVRIYEELYQHIRPKADPAPVKNLCKRLIAINAERNRTLHALWFGGAAGEELAALRISRGSGRGGTERRKITRSELHGLATQIGEVGDELSSFAMLTATRMKQIGVPEDEK